MTELNPVAMTRKRVMALLDNIEQSGKSTVTAYCAGDSSMESVEKLVGVIPGIETGFPDLRKYMMKSSTGSVLFRGDENTYLISPPFPVRETILFQGVETELLKNILLQDRMIALLLIRLNRYGIGVFRGSTMISGKAGTGLVHSRHHKGGSSAHRFERHREKQIEYYFTRICGHVRGQIDPYLGELDHVCYGGERYTIKDFVEQCTFAQKLESKRMDRLLDIREPKLETLKAAIDLAYGCSVIEWSSPA
jgi:peptide subunit release factor 1 (eRF1)